MADGCAVIRKDCQQYPPESTSSDAYQGLLFYVFLLTSIGHLSRFIIGIAPSAVALSRALNLHDSSICATSVRVLDNPN